jgi:uncharacterized SAM-binding protein YcdF (DUF218 family)
VVFYFPNELHPLETRFEINPELPASIEGIIVLSDSLNVEQSSLWQQVQANGANDKELAFMKMMNDYPQAKLVYSGGSSGLTSQEYKAADVALKLFLEQGLDTTRIVFERESRNTFENASLSYELVNPNLEKPWILITSAFHMPRSIGIFCEIGWPLIPFPVDHRTTPTQELEFGFNLGGHLSLLDIAIHEWLGLLAYRVSGKTASLLPDRC